MFRHARRIALSLVAVVGGYWAYALLAVPALEGSDTLAHQRRQARSTAEQRQDAAAAVARQREALSWWFAPGDWELESPKVLETSQGRLLLKTYRNLDDGRVELRPCTMIFMPQDPTIDDATRHRQAIVLRAPEGAILQFDSPFDLKQARIGKLVGGRLVGPVFIHSDQKNPGPDDDLRIITRDVDLNEQQITSPHPMEFQLGPNRGRGEQLLVTMAEKQAGSSDPGLHGITSFELARQVVMRLYPGRGELFPGSTEPARAEPADAPPLPVDVECSGPFRFDLVGNVATFTENVEVMRANVGGGQDQMSCQRMSIYFQQRDQADRPAAPPDDRPDPPKLEPVRLEAVGAPVVIRAPSRGVQASADQVDYDIRTGAAQMSSQQHVILRQGQREIGARAVDFKPDQSNGMGEFLAEGPGWFKGASPDDPQQWIEARFGRRAQFGPHEHNQLLTLEGAAHVESIGTGALDAEQIFFWVIEVPRRDPQGRTTDKKDLMPDRLLARGAVKIASPQLTGDVDQLEAWFEPLPAGFPLAKPRPAHRAGYPPPQYDAALVPVAAAAPLVFPADAAPSSNPPPAAPRVQPALAVEPLPPPAGFSDIPQPRFPAQPDREAPPIGPLQQPPLAPPAAPTRQFHIDGKVLRLRVLTDGRNSHLSEVVVQQNVRLRETQTEKPDEQPLVILGDLLHLVQALPEQAVVTVNGSPAYVEARGLTLRGPALRLDQARNETGVEGAGVMTLPVNQDLQGQTTATPQPMEVTWQGRMTFDGLTARFFQGVEARVAHQRLRTEQMEVQFTHPVKFGETTTEQPEVQTLVCRGGAYLENHAYEGRALQSIDMLQAADLVVDRATGDMVARGPGWVRSTRWSGGDDPAGRFTVGPAGNQKPSTSSGERELVYLFTSFQRQLTGNLHRKVTVFEGQVRTIYGPVLGWDMQLDIDRPETWGPRGVHIRCDRLQVAETPAPAGSQRSHELEATGNTQVEGNGENGSSFNARCWRLTYAQGKDQLVLEGDGRTDAWLARQTRAGGPTSEASARKIMYSPSTNRLNIDDAGFIDLSTPAR